MILIRSILLLILLSVSSVQAQDLNTLLQQGQNYIVTGHYYEAVRQLDKAKAIATDKGDSYYLTFINVLEGYINLQQQNFKKSKELLLLALKQSTQQNWIDLTAKTQLYLGELKNRQKCSLEKDSQYYFKKIVDQSAQITEKALVISAYLHLIKANQDGKPDDIPIQLKEAEAFLITLPIDKKTAQAWLSLGHQAFIYQKDKKDNPTGFQTASRYLNKALIHSKAFKQPRVQASALQYLAQLDQQQNRVKDAIDRVQQGLYITQKIQASDIAIHLEALLAKLFYTKNKLPDAKKAYKRAIQHIEDIRVDIPISYNTKGDSSFRDKLAPIYLGLADLLLQQSAEEVDASLEQTLLKEAQDVIELMKKNELEDFFQKRCEIATTPINLKKTDPHAAAIYPISFKDRLDIIVYTSQGLKRFSSPVSAKILDETARAYAKDLREGNELSTIEHKREAILLYKWLIAPLDAYLKQQKIETLVYIPDGVLRLLPLSALYNNEKFLIEDYAVVTLPGMSLIESKITNYNQQQAILFAGLSHLGDVIYDLPYKNLIDKIGDLDIKDKKANIFLSDWIRQNKNIDNCAKDQQKKTLKLLFENSKITAAIKKVFNLKVAKTEIETLAQNNQMPYLLNERFSLKDFSDTLDKKPYKILHIATHGVFGGTENESYIMTHDKILTINKLERLLTTNHFKKSPLDLLILSACQTAEGDDKSPLGFSGVAIKAKVRSVLGSLWNAYDEATAQLMMAFYDALKDPTLSKAQALRKAKLSLLKQKKFSHPKFWSSLILVGNWK
ncbi:MAG: CHAT domain-containing protein [Methylococcales bacterium]|nr:CHAT domain-containing protein [Methylococcales bacterium]